MKIQIITTVELDDSKVDEAGAIVGSAEWDDTRRNITANGSKRDRELLRSAGEPVPAADYVQCVFLGYFPHGWARTGELTIVDRKAKVVR